MIDIFEKSESRVENTERIIRDPAPEIVFPFTVKAEKLAVAPLAITTENIPKSTKSPNSISPVTLITAIPETFTFVNIADGEDS